MARCLSLALWVGLAVFACQTKVQAQYYPESEAGFAPGYAPQMGEPPVPYGDGVVRYGADGYATSVMPDQPQLFSDRFLDADQYDIEDLFFRSEYVLWNFDTPGRTLLGAPVLFVDDESEFREIFDDLGDPFGFAAVPNLDQIHLFDNSGFRGTVGIPLTFGSFEASWMGFEKAEDTLFVDLDPTSTFFLATSTFVNGQIDDNLELYNDFFRATVTSQLWGAETNLFLNGPENTFLHFQPMIGFRFLNLHEKLIQRGRFVPDPATGLPAVDTSIDSTSYNNVFLPQIGLRTEFRSEYFAFAFDPKFGMGPNSYTNRVRTDNFRSNGDPEVLTEDQHTQLAAYIDLGFTGRVRVHKNIWLTAGYNFIFLSRVTRAHDNVYYNDNGPLPTLPGIVVRTQKDDITMDGLSVGAEIRW